MMRLQGFPSPEDKRREEFWRKLIARYHARLRAYCGVFQSTPDDLDDLLWDIWHDAIECEATLAASDDQWPVLKRLARAACAPRRRQWRRERPIDDDAAIESIDAVEERETDRVLREWSEGVLAALPEEERLAVEFRFRWGWPYWAVAAAIDTGEPTARVYVARGLQRLRRLAEKSPPPTLNA